MPDIFLSYSHLDNRDLESVTYEVPTAIDRFLQIYEHELGLSVDQMSRRIFRDRWSIEAGQVIPDAIERAITECPVMLAFFSPSYFRSRECLAEWRAFHESMERVGLTRDGKPKKLLIPIEVKPVGGDIEPVDERYSREWYADIVSATGRKRTITSAVLVQESNAAALGQAVRQLGSVIDAHLAVQEGTVIEQRSDPNVLRVQTPITRPTLAAPKIAAELRAAPRLRYSRHLPVCVIYAGGTVGMVETRDSDPIHADFEMASGIDDIFHPLATRLWTLPVNLHLFRLAKTIDSSAVTAANWVHLAQLIREQQNHYQGFVILHGTNTLAYSASALSFLLADSITKPVILTGSEVPLSNVNTDAVHNVENAIRAAAHEAYGGPVLIREVCVYWNNHLYRGNRVTKKIASDRSASFHCPNMPASLAILANDSLEVEHMQINPIPLPEAAPPQPIRDLSAIDVAILFIHPDMDFQQVNRGYAQSPDGLILLSYGPGNVPDDEVFITMIRRLIDDNTIVANVTQCPYGRVELKLFETSATLFDLGVIDGYDMTLEAAYTKLLWAIAEYPEKASRALENTRDAIKSHFQEDVAGEMSASIYGQHWPADRFTPSTVAGYRVSDTGSFRGRFGRLDIAEAFIRLEGLRFPPGLDRAVVRVYYGQPPADTEPGYGEADNLLAEFTKVITNDERDRGIDKNLKVTHTFRKAFTNKEFVVSVGVDGSPGISFKSVRLVVYTKGRRRRDT